MLGFLLSVNRTFLNVLFVSIITETIAEYYDQYSNKGEFSILKENAEIIEKLG